MRVVVPLLFLVLGWLGGALAEEPARPWETVNAARIDELIRQLGSEDYQARDAATQQLRDVVLAGEAQLDAAVESADPEVRLRVALVLEGLGGHKAQRAFLEAMEGPWMEALKEGRLTGPLFGVATMNTKPRLVSLEALGEPAEGELPKFMARMQSPEGRWNSRLFGAQAPADVEQTALALLSFLGAGHTEKVGTYKHTVRKAVGWLRTRQRQDGAILNEGWTQVDGVAHALALLALSEAAGMANVPDTAEAAQKAVEFAAKGLQTGGGYERNGFFRSAGSPPDLFTTTLFTMALKSAKVAGLKVDTASFEGVIKFLDSVEDKEHHTYRFIPMGKPSPRAALMVSVSRHLLCWKKEDLTESVAAALKELGEPSTGHDESDNLINYFGTMAAFHQGGEIWANWNDALKKSLVEGQIQEGAARGSWAPAGVWSGGGYVLSTSLNALSLEVYYRYLRLYK